MYRKQFKFDFVFILLFITLLSCAASPEGEEHFWLRSKGADMPVMVRGNKASGIYIILSPGWPGLGLIYSIEESFLALEKDFALVYWNYRGSGSSRGSLPQGEITMEEIIQDLGILKDVITEKYQSPDIYLLAHSFGGTVAGNYLAASEFNHGIRGLISLDSSLDRLQFMKHVRDLVVGLAEQSSDQKFKEEVLALYKTDPDNHSAFFPYARERRILDPLLDKTRFFGNILGQSFVQSFGNTEIITTQFGAFDKLYVTDDFPETIDEDIYVKDLEKITIPVILLHGMLKHEGLGQENAAHVLALLGTSATQKKYIMFEKSGHFLYVTEPEKFSKSVKSFIRETQGG